MRGDNCAASLEHRMSRVSPSLRLAHTHRYNIIVYRLYYRIYCAQSMILCEHSYCCAPAAPISPKALMALMAIIFYVDG